jgi:hypothetical protein
VALAFEVVFGDRSGRSELVEVMEVGHHLGLIDRLAIFLLSALLASFALGRFAVVALSGYAAFACAFASPAHLEFLVMRF